MTDKPKKTKPKKPPKPPAPRFLAPAARFGDGLGYLNRPLRECPLVADSPEVVARIAEARRPQDEPESIGRAIVDAQTDLARRYDELRHRAMVEQACEMRRQLDLEARMVEAQRRAKLQHVNIRPDLHLIAKMLDRSKRAGHKQEPPAAVIRMEAVERRLDGVREDEAA